MKVKRNADSIGTTYDLLELKPGEVEAIIQSLRRDVGNMSLDLQSMGGSPGSVIVQAAIDRRQELITTLTKAVQ